MQTEPEPEAITPIEPRPPHLFDPTEADEGFPSLVCARCGEPWTHESHGRRLKNGFWIFDGGML